MQKKVLNVARPDIGGPTGVEERKCPGNGDREESTANRCFRRKEKMCYITVQRKIATQCYWDKSQDVSLSPLFHWENYFWGKTVKGFLFLEN